MPLTLWLLVPCLAAPEPAGPVAAWDFTEGAGERLADASGNGNDGTIHGAAWVRAGDGWALRFDGIDDRVDCGTGASLDVRGPLTLETWVYPEAPPTAEPGLVGKFFESYALTYYKTGSAYLYISSGGNNVHGGIRVGEWTHLAGVFDGRTLRFYLNGVEVGSQASKFPEVKPGGRFLMGCVLGDAANVDEALRHTAYFQGLLTGVRVYGRALSQREVIGDYNRRAAGLGREPFDTSRFGRLMLEAYVYPESAVAVAVVNDRWARPLPDGAKLVAVIVRRGETKPLARAELEPPADSASVELTLPLTGLPDGDYLLRAAVEAPGGPPTGAAEVPLRLPAAAPAPPDPVKQVAGPLPTRAKSPNYRLTVSDHGGFTIRIGDRDFPIESTFSQPGGGHPGLTPIPAPGESGWKVAVQRTQDGATIRAESAAWRLDRKLRRTPSRVVVEDTFTNRTDGVVGVIVQHAVDTRGLADAENTVLGNPTVFVARGRSGVGLVALDDVSYLHCVNGVADGRVYLRDEHFGLAAGARYTVRWAAYPTGSDDYYDFINQVRRDEQLNGHVAGGFTFTGSWTPPDEAALRHKGVKYLSFGSLTRLMHNPTISVEGWEFVDYPELCEKLKVWSAACRAKYPGLKVGFHVAHSLYATDKPRELFGDSLVVDANGHLDHYGPNTAAYYNQYFSPELVEAGWRWWLYYPAPDNRFGQFMLDSAEAMLKLGSDVIWADGYISAYVKGGYTYDRFDGHSVIIDPTTHRVTRQVTHPAIIGLPILKEVARKFAAAGGVLITNGQPGPMSFCREAVISSCETGGGDQQPIAALHLGRTVTPLGNPTAIRTPRDLYRDILAKLDLGALYFWYGDRGFVTEPSIVASMYPLTFESIHAGTVGGRERIVTKVPGVHGWPGDRSLHAVVWTDARGKLRPNRFWSTADQSGVRTQLDLGAEQMAVIARLPVSLDCDRPVNVLVRGHDERSIELTVNGHGPARLRLPGTYQATVAGKPAALKADGQQKALPLTLDGELAVALSKQP